MSDQAGIVFIVEDDESVRASLRALMESEGFDVADFASAEALLASFERGPVGRDACVLLDVRLPGLSGIALLDQLADRDPAMPVILISAHTDVPLAVRAMRRGAVDVIEKPFHGQEVLARVRDAMTLHHSRHRAHAQRQSLRERYLHLSRREKQVMALVARGQLNKQIAIELNLSTKTVECHRARVMEKMEAPSLADLVRQAVALEEAGVMEDYSAASRSSAN